MAVRVYDHQAQLAEERKVREQIKRNIQKAEAKEELLYLITVPCRAITRDRFHMGDFHIRKNHSRIYKTNRRTKVRFS